MLLRGWRAKAYLQPGLCKERIVPYICHVWVYLESLFLIERGFYWVGPNTRRKCVPYISGFFIGLPCTLPGSYGSVWKMFIAVSFE